MNNEFTEQVKKRKYVIGVQLGVLALVLIVLFSGALLPPDDEPNRGIDLDSVAVTKPADTTWERLVLTDIQARAAHVYDVRAKETIFEKNASEALPIASITKLMTGLVSYELIEQSEAGTIDEQAINQSGASGLQEGDTLSLRSLNYLSLISSSNDAAFALAATVGSQLGDQDPAAQFVAGMNIRAKEIGLESFDFKNPTGLDISISEPGAVGSAEDVSKLMVFMLENYPELLEPTQNTNARVRNQAGGYLDIENTNNITYAIPNLLASKTGYTDLAGGNLTIAFDAGFNRPMIITVLGSSRQGRFNDVLTIIDAIEADLASNQ